jgi:hypothetical protein
MTFLEIVRWSVRESGTVGAPNAPSSVIGQEGRLARFVHWCADAYDAIQTDRGDWRWLEDEFDGTLQPALAEYDAGALGITRFRRWHRISNRQSTVSLYDPDAGPQEEAPLAYCDWPSFYTMYRIGGLSLTTGRPQVFTVDPKGRIVVAPKPDKAYRLRGLYLRSAQRLAGNLDVPEMPEDFHRMIPLRALMMMSTFDEAFEQKPHWGAEYGALFSQLVRDQVDQPQFGGPLA